MKKLWTCLCRKHSVRTACFSVHPICTKTLPGRRSSAVSWLPAPAMRNTVLFLLFTRNGMHSYPTWVWLWSVKSLAAVSGGARRNKFFRSHYCKIKTKSAYFLSCCMSRCMSVLAVNPEPSFSMLPLFYFIFIAFLLGRQMCWSLLLVATIETLIVVFFKVNYKVGDTDTEDALILWFDIINGRVAF